MEIKEPYVEYGLSAADSVTLLKDELIAAIRDLTDAKLLQRCLALLNAKPPQRHTTDEKNEMSSGTRHVVLSFDELRPELQHILKMSEPMKGKIPEWDLEGNLTREEAMKDM